VRNRPLVGDPDVIKLIEGWRTKWWGMDVINTGHWRAIITIARAGDVVIRAACTSRGSLDT
jgi:hypothetical protein